MKDRSQILFASAIAISFQILFVLSFTPYFYRPAEMAVFFANIGVATAAIAFIRYSMGKRFIFKPQIKAVTLMLPFFFGSVVGIGSMFIGEFVFLILYAVEIGLIVTLLQFLVSWSKSSCAAPKLSITTPS